MLKNVLYRASLSSRRPLLKTAVITPKIISEPVGPILMPPVVRYKSTMNEQADAKASEQLFSEQGAKSDTATSSNA